MKKSLYTDLQIVRISREAYTAPIAEVARRHVVRERSISGWRKRFGEMKAKAIKNQKALGQENAQGNTKNEFAADGGY